jgi:hypothetical protein
MLGKSLCNLFALLGVAPRALSQESAPIEAWLEKECELSQHVPDFGGYYVCLHTEEFNTLSAAELDELKAEVETHPDHPRRAEYNLMMRRLTNGPTITRLSIFGAGDGKWRFNTDNEDGGFQDVAMSPGSAWQLGPAALKIFNPKEIGTDPEQNVKNQERVFRPSLNRLLFGGLGYQGSDFKPRPGVKILGDKWVAIVGRPADIAPERQFELEVTGRWDANLGRGFFETIKIITSGFSKTGVGEHEVFSDWKLDPSLNMWIASRADRYNAAGVLYRRVVFDATKNIPAGGFDGVATAPSIDAGDPIRGVVQFRSVTDYRKRIQSNRADPASPLSASPMAPLPKDDPQWITVAGWILLGALAVLLTIAAWNRRRFRAAA